MRKPFLAVFWCLICLPLAAHSQCAKDYRSSSSGGVIVTDFIISGTATISSTTLARMSGAFIGSCYADDTDEMSERLRAEFQNRGYFSVEIRDLSFKTSDALGTPKPVTVAADVVEGPRFKVGEINFLDNHAFSTKKLRAQFPLKHGEIFEREKIASGIESLRKLYAAGGFLDFYCMPDTEPGATGTMNLKFSIVEGPQYHMGKLEIVASEDLAARVRTAWKMSEGSIFDKSYIGKFINENPNLLPDGFTAESGVKQVSNCPDAVVDVQLVIDATKSVQDFPVKNTPCQSAHDKPKAN